MNLIIQNNQSPQTPAFKKNVYTYLLAIMERKLYNRTYIGQTSSFLSTFMDPSDLNFGQLLFLLNNEVLKTKNRSI